MSSIKVDDYVVYVAEPSKALVSNRRVLATANTYVLIPVVGNEGLAGEIFVLSDNIIFTMKNSVGGGLQYVSDIDSYTDARVCWIAVDKCALFKEIATPAVVRGTPDGACCQNCHEFSPMAESGFTCFACREDKYRNSY